MSREPPERGLETYLGSQRPWCPQSLGDAVDGFMEASGLKARLKQRKIHAVWDRALGARADAVRIVSLRSGVLEAEVGSAALLHELEFEKHVLLRVMQAEVKRPFIRRIVFRLGSLNQDD